MRGDMSEKSKPGERNVLTEKRGRATVFGLGYVPSGVGHNPAGFALASSHHDNAGFGDEIVLLVMGGIIPDLRS